MEKINNKQYAWRWAVLLVVVLNIGLNYLINTISPSGKSMKELTAQYPSLFTPAGYAFSIWGLIYLSQLVYAIVQVLPSRRNVATYDLLAKPFVLTTVLGMCWLFLFTSDHIGLSLLFIVGMMATAIHLFRIAKREVTLGHVSAWLEVPFSTYAGWLSVATIANTSLYLVALGWEGGTFGPSAWAIIMVCVASILGIVVGFYGQDYLYPLTVAWGILAIWVARRSDEPPLALVALVGALVLVAVGILLVFRRYVLFGHAKRSSVQVI